MSLINIYWYFRFIGSDIDHILYYWSYGAGPLCQKSQISQFDRDFWIAHASEEHDGSIRYSLVYSTHSPEENLGKDYNYNLCADCTRVKIMMELAK